jgi:DNA polymerase III subunit delta'
MIDDADKILENSRGWKELVTAAETKHSPQSVAAVVPLAMQQMFVERYGKLILGESPMWKDGLHPDLISAGKYMTPPSIDDCRLLQGELGLYPLVSDKRLAVIWSADKISLEASNSLLKLAEEPPERACLLFVSEEDKLIPTIKSRVWSIYVELPEELIKPRRHPESPEEWAAWLENGKKYSAEILYLEIESWIKHLIDNGKYVKAANLESLVRLMEQKRLSVAMIQDLTFAVIKEGNSYDQIFGNLW